MLRAFGVLCLATLLTVALLITAANSGVNDQVAMSVGIASSLAACCIWWIANADDDGLSDDIDADAPVGGDDGAELAGSLDGIEH